MMRRNHTRCDGGGQAAALHGRSVASMFFVVMIGLLLVSTAAGAHHVGAYVPRDNDVSANFKQIKFSLQAEKFAVAAALYDAGALRRELLKRAATLPSGLDASIRGALKAGDARGADTGLMVFFAALVRDLALEADRQLADARAPAATRVAGGGKILEAIWRYYNLVDFAVSERDPKAATAVRLAFEDAEAQTKVPTPQPERMRLPLATIARVLAGVIDASSNVRTGVDSPPSTKQFTRRQV